MREILTLPLDEPVPVDPREHQQLVGAAGLRVLLRDDGNARARREATGLLRADLTDARQVVLADSAVLKDHVPLGRRAVAQGQLPFLARGVEEVTQLVAVL